MIAIYTDYNAAKNTWSTFQEVHASIQAAKIRAKAKGWALLGVKRVSRLPVVRSKRVSVVDIGECTSKQK